MFDPKNLQKLGKVERVMVGEGRRSSREGTERIQVIGVGNEPGTEIGRSR